jgi:pyruvate dehydrogenase E1 component alpha subunit
MTTVAAAPGRLSSDRLSEAYRVMRTIRALEERLHEEHASGEIQGALHLYAGQEAIAAGVFAHLRRDDVVAGTHRSHGHAVAKGCDLTELVSEIYGRAPGLCGGKGGSMHVADVSLGLLGANGIAGGGVPLGCGAALSAKVRGSDQIAVAFVGDGGANQGAFLESLVLASVWRLPCVFVVENNGYAQSTGARFHLNGTDVSARAPGFAMPGETVAGDDFFAVYDAAGDAVERARSGGGPTLLECKAPRFFGHMEGFDKQAYRGPGEVDRLRAEQDCIASFVDRVRESDALTAAAMAAIDESVAEQVDAAIAAARTAPEPDPVELATDVYAADS